MNMSTDVLHRALHDPGPPHLSPLPSLATDLLMTLHAPARLGAHLRLVHDVAQRLMRSWVETFPAVAVNDEAVEFGAAIHDIGKVIHPEELIGPGHAHEAAGQLLLLDHGITDELARFAGTHADWHRPAATLDELLVSLADQIWRGRRQPDLEQRIIGHVTEASDKPSWQVFLSLDDIATDIAKDAETRLAFQSRFPAHP